MGPKKCRQISQQKNKKFTDELLQQRREKKNCIYTTELYHDMALFCIANHAFPPPSSKKMSDFKSTRLSRPPQDCRDRLAFLQVRWPGLERKSLGHISKGGIGKGGIRMCLPVHCLSARSDRQLLSRKCDILSLLKDDQSVRDNRLPVHCRHLASRRHRTAIPVATQMSLPPVCLPPV